MKKAEEIDWQKVKVVIFDVDGTLYTQSRIRKKMLLALLKHYALRPWRLQDLLILRLFRAERERMAGYSFGDVENAQYEWCARKGNYAISRVKKVVALWMFEYPNKYLDASMFPGVKLFFDALRQNNIKIGIYSDYKAVDKLEAMKLEADMVVCSTDEEIDYLKPNPKGLLYIAEKLGVSPTACLFIGDRQELDGECALKAGMPYLIVDKKRFDEFDFYTSLTHQLAYFQAKAPLETL